MLQETFDSFYATDAQYGLAIAHIAFDNPQKNYAQALHECEEFSKLFLNRRGTAEVQNLIGILKTVTNMSKSIEELNQREMRHEERRKTH